MFDNFYIHDIGACGQYGAFFGKRTSAHYWYKTIVKNCGNIEICYKICKNIHPCKAWTYNLKDLSCTLINFDNALSCKKDKACKIVRWTLYKDYNLSTFSYNALNEYNSTTNPRISGPRECPWRWWNWDVTLQVCSLLKRFIFPVESLFEIHITYLPTYVYVFSFFWVQISNIWGKI